MGVLPKYLQLQLWEGLLLAVVIVALIVGLVSISSFPTTSIQREEDISGVMIEVAQNKIDADTKCAADLNNDKLVNEVDKEIFLQNYKQQLSACELDIVGEDCQLTIADMREFTRQYGAQTCDVY